MARTVDLAVKDAAGVSALYAPRRTLLDAVLVDAAREAGAAHGITDALRDAELLARALVHGGHTRRATTQALAEYEWTRDLVSRQLFDVTERIASLAWTLDEVSQLITDLSDAMVPETDLLTGSSHPTSREAVA
jgi:hypothetical protein